MMIQKTICNAKNIIFLFLFFLPGWAQAEPSILVATDNRLQVSENVFAVRPIASITKLMTAIVVLENEVDLEKKIPLIDKWSTILPRKKYSKKDLLTAMLVRSDNSAAETLAHDHPGGRSSFMRAMNSKAREIGMQHTSFNDPTGLSVFNTSTANDVHKLLEAAYEFALIKQISTMKEAQISNDDRKKVRQIVFSNTNHPVLTQFNNVTITKTGLTNAAGWCVALVVEENQKRYFIVILGSKTKQTRLDKVREIMYTHIVSN